MDQFIREIHKRIDSFETQMRERLHKARDPYLLILHKDVSILRFEVRRLVEMQTPIILKVIPLILQLLTTPPLLIFNFFVTDDKPRLLGPRENESPLSKMKVQISLRGI